jgi:hypothetical protein
MAGVSEFTQEIADTICAQLSDGKSLRSVCRQPEMPALSTVFKWLRVFPSFAEQYARAKDEGADAMAEDIMDISDEEPRMTINKAGAEVVDSGYETFRKTRIDVRKWAASKLKPKKYGDKLELAGDKDRPLVVQTIGLVDLK